MPKTPEQIKEDARRRQANKRARAKGLPEPYAMTVLEEDADNQECELQMSESLSWAQAQDATGKFYKSECRSAVQLLAIYGGNPYLNGEVPKVDPKTGKAQNVPNPSKQAVRIRAIQLAEVVDDQLKIVHIDPRMKEYRNTYEVNHVVKFQEWLDLRDKARKDLFWLGRLLDRSFFHSTHQQMCDMFVKKNFDGLFFPDFTSDDVHDAIAAQKKYRLTEKGEQTDTMMLFAPRSSYKSTIDGIDIVQWMINCPDVRVMILTSVLGLSRQFLAEIKSYYSLGQMAQPSAFQLLFPEYILTGVDGTSEQPIECPARTYTSKEPHVWVTSLDASFVGQRCDIRKLDDCVDDKNSANDELRLKLADKIASTNALAEPWGFTDVIGTRYFTTDWYAYRMTSQDDEEVEPYTYLSLSAWTPKPEHEAHYNFLLSEKNGMFKVTEDMVNLFFPSKLHFKELRKRLREYKERGFKNQYLNIATDPLEESEFVVHFDLDSLRRHTYDYTMVPESGEDIVTVDWAYTDNRTSDYTAFVASRRHIRADNSQELIVKEIQYGKWKTSDIALKLVLFLRQHRPQRCFIEQANGWDLLYAKMIDYATQFGCLEVIQTVLPFPVERGAKAKANRVKMLELLISEDRLHFVSGPWLDEMYKQFVRFTGEMKLGRKDDIPDAISMAARTLPQDMFKVAVPATTEEDRMRAEDLDRKRRRDAHYKQYFGDHYYGGVTSAKRQESGTAITPQPTQHAPTVRQYFRGPEPPKKEEPEPEPEKPRDPRMRIFGNKGPWRL